MARKKTDTIGQPAVCSECGVNTHMFICKGYNLPDGTWTDPLVFCLPCHEITYERDKKLWAKEKARAEQAVRNYDWEF